jgi:hypothetical protein
MFGRFINKLWPLKEFLNYIFKKTLGDYIMNDLDLNKIEVEIKNNTFISLQNLELNAFEINRKHLQSSPIKMLEGRINRLDLIVSKEKLEIKIEEVFILLMPVFDEEKFNHNNLGKKIIYTSQSESEQENSLVSNLINSALANLEVSVKNICVKILTYEAFNNSRDNPTISLFIGKIEYRKNKYEEDEEKCSTTEFKNKRDKILNFDEKNYLEKNSSPKNSTNDKLFFFNKQILFDKICVKIDRNIKKDESTFFNICKLNDEKLLFNFFCDNSTIMCFSMNYSEDRDRESQFHNESSFYINLLESSGNTQGQTSQENNSNTGLKIEAYFKKIEIFITPFQLQILKNFMEICTLIFNKKIKDPKINLKSNSTQVHGNSNTPLKIFNHKLTSLQFNFYLEMFNVILNENYYAYETPKLWSFYENNYCKTLKSIESLESHFSYTEDNFFIFNLNKLSGKFSKFMGYDNSKRENKNEFNPCQIKFDLNLESINLKFIEYKNKIKNKEKTSPKKLKFSNSKISSSRINSMKENSNFKVDTSVNASVSIYQTIYQSVISGENYLQQINPNNSNNSLGSIYESALESEILLVEKFNKLLDFDYFYYSNPILTLKPQFQSEKFSLDLNFIKSDSSGNLGIKNYINLSLGDLAIDLHPILAFKFVKLIYANSILINEILYYFNCSQSFVREEENSEEEGKNLKRNKSKETSEKSEKYGNSEKLENSPNSLHENLNNNTNKNPCDDEKEKIQSITQKSQILISIYEMKISLQNFLHGNKNSTLNSYFSDFYKNNIEEVNNCLSQGYYKERLQINTETLIQNLKSNEILTLKIVKPKVLINIKKKIKSTSSEKSSNSISLNFDQILAYFNNYMLLNYNKNSTLSNSNGQYLNNTIKFDKEKSQYCQNLNTNMFTLVVNKKPASPFVTENFSNNISESHLGKNKFSQINSQSLPQIDLDTIYNKNNMNFRSYDLKLENYTSNITQAEDFNINKKVKEPISEIYTSQNIHKEVHIDKILPEQKKFIKNIIKLNFKKNLNFFTNLKVLENLARFFDDLMFSINIFKIIAVEMKKNYDELKFKIFEIFEIFEGDFLNLKIQYEKKYNKFDIIKKPENDNSLVYKFNLIYLTTTNINLFLTSLKNIQEEDILLKLNLNKLSLNLISLNDSNELLLNLNNIRLLSKKPILILPTNITNEDYINRIDDKIFNYLLYKGNTSERSNCIQILMNFKEEGSAEKNDNFNFENLYFQDKIGAKCDYNSNLQIEEKNITNTKKSTCNHIVTYLNFENFIDKNLLNLKNLTMKLNIALNDLIFCPLNKDSIEIIFQEIFYHQEKQNQDFPMQEKNSNSNIKLKNLLSNRKLNLSLKLEIHNLALDIIYHISSNKKESIRFLFLIEKITHDKKKDKSNLSCLKLYNLQIQLLQNLTLEGTDKLLLNKLFNIGKENSIFKQYGFIEIFNLEKMEIKLSKEDEGAKIDIMIGAIELNFCKDSFTAIINLTKFIIERKNEIFELKKLKKEKLENDLNNDYINKHDLPLQVQEKQGEKLPNINVKESQLIYEEPESHIQIYEDYCEGGDYMKDLILLNDDIANINSPLIDQVVNSIEKRRKRSSFDIINKDLGIEENKLTLSLGDMIINLSLSSFRLYLFKGRDFDFKENSSVRYIGNNNNVTINTSHRGSEMFFSVPDENLLIESSFSNISSKIDFIEDYIPTNKGKNKISTLNEENNNNFSNSNSKISNITTTITNDIKIRERRKPRDYDNHIGVNLQNLNFEGIFYNNLIVSNTNAIKNSDKNFTIKLSIEKLDIDDYVKLSKYKKLFSKYDHEDPRPFISFNGEMLRNTGESLEDSYGQTDTQKVKMVNSGNVEIEDSEFYSDIYIAPINFLLDQYTLIFLLDFFSVKLNSNIVSEKSRSNDSINSRESLRLSLSPESKQEKFSQDNKKLQSPKNSSVKLIFVRKVKINEFFINLSYNSHSIDMKKLKNKNYLELLNLSNITDFRIILKSIDFLGCKTINDTLDMIFNFWKDDITKNQIFSAILQSISVIRPFTTVFEGFLDIFKQPLIYYRTEKSFNKGFKKGLKNFLISFTSQSLFLGEKVKIGN